MANKGRNDLIFEIVERDGPKCFYCDKECCFWWRVNYPNLDNYHPDKMTVEHIIPISHGGLDIIDNLVIACEECNQNRDDKCNEKVLAFLLSISAQRREKLIAMLQINKEEKFTRRRMIKKRIMSRAISNYITKINQEILQPTNTKPVIIER